MHRTRVMKRRLRRPYELGKKIDSESVKDPQGELEEVVTWLQDILVKPIDSRLPGRPFEYDIFTFPFTPMVLLIGNHSAGKSTFINRLLGLTAQETGVAPTDDGFTVLERHPEAKNETEDGPTLLGCPENRPYRELQRFGQAFWGHLRRKRLKLSDSAAMPLGLQVVDTPGMIDLPEKAGVIAGGRGYNFLEVVRWFAKRADLILLLFDPDRPGTTVETLDVLTKSLAGLDHKFLIVLNKMDELDNAVDFARCYATLGWAISKVIPRKDLPLIYTMYNAGVETDERKEREHKLPLEAFRQKRDEVIAEVMRSKVRHWDNVVTSLEDTLRQMDLISTVCMAVRDRVIKRSMQVRLEGLTILVAPALAAAMMLRPGLQDASGLLAGCFAAYAAVCGGTAYLLQEYVRQFEELQITSLDSFFQEAYAEEFIHTDGEDLRARWITVRPKIFSMLRFVPSVRKLPAIHRWEIDRIKHILSPTGDIWHLRQLAKLMRATAS